MRIWSLHPKYLDVKGLVALWRETLLAKNVLEGNTKGYKNHPQLIRFKNMENPLSSINLYLLYVWKEAKSRNYNFNKNKIGDFEKEIKMSVTKGQIEYEFRHLLKKLEKRYTEKFIKLKDIKNIKAHPIFKITKGDIEEWEIL